MVFGATGPVDAALRRPWIDWIHTSRDQGALVRDYVKWDDQPGSPEAAIESVLRANRIMRRHPQGPVYIVLDVAMQESKLDSVPKIPDVARLAVESDPAPTAESLMAALEMLKSAMSPLIMAGWVSRNQVDWDRRIAFAEALDANVITNQRIAAAFPTHHPLHPNHLNYQTTTDGETLIRDTDVILNLDWLDFGGHCKPWETSVQKSSASPWTISIRTDGHSTITSCPRLICQSWRRLTVLSHWPCSSWTQAKSGLTQSRPVRRRLGRLPSTLSL